MCGGRGQHAKSRCTLSCTCTGILLPPSALSQSAAVSAWANQVRGSLLEMLRSWGEGTVSKSYPVRQGCIKIHTALKHQAEYWSAHRSRPAAPLREKKGIFPQRYPRLQVPYIHISIKPHHGWKQRERKIRRKRVGKGRVGENAEHEIPLYKAVVSLMWCCSHDRKEESERISIYDDVWGQMWACNHMLLLFSPLYIMFALSVNHL